MSSKATQNVDPPRTRSKSTSHNQSLQNTDMGSTHSMPQSLQLAQPLPKFILETTMKVSQVKSLAKALYGKTQQDGDASLPERNVEEIPIKSVVNMNDFIQVEDGEKLNLLMVAINKMNTTFQYKTDQIMLSLTDEEDGVFPRLRECESDIDDFCTRIEKLEEKNQMLKDDTKLLKGIVQVQQNQIEELAHVVSDNKSRSMKNNITIDGLLPDTDDAVDCKKQVLDFMREKLEMEIADQEVIKAHRLGEKSKWQSKDYGSQLSRGT